MSTNLVQSIAQPVCPEDNIEPVADKIATTKFADKEKPKWDPEPRNLRARGSGLLSGANEVGIARPA